jgi:hypothetical protein
MRPLESPLCQTMAALWIVGRAILSGPQLRLQTVGAMRYHLSRILTLLRLGTFDAGTA